MALAWPKAETQLLAACRTVREDESVDRQIAACRGHPTHSGLGDRGEEPQFDPNFGG